MTRDIEYYPIALSNDSFIYTRWINSTVKNDQLYYGDFDGTTYSLSINQLTANNSDVYPVDNDYVIFSTTRYNTNYDLALGKLSSGDVWPLSELGINSSLQELGACYVIPSSLEYYLEVSTTELNLSGEEGSNDTFNIFSNISWNISESTDWSSVSQTQGSGDAEITVTTLDSNKTGSTREGLIVISGNGVQSKEITVYQESLSTSLNAPSLTLPANGSSITDQTPYFEWETVDGATSYQVQVDNNNDFSSPELDQTLQENYYQVSNTLNYDTYNWRVKASNSTQESIWSDIWTFTITKSSANTDRDALIALYNSTNGDNWTNNENWLSDKPLTEWYGIDTVENRVSEIFLENNNLVGLIPSEIGLLTELRSLNLGLNSISGPIPNEIGDLFLLNRLYLFGNQLSGELPNELYKLINLEVLMLHVNNFSGHISKDIKKLVKLKLLILGYNNFLGKIPEELSELTNLTDLVLDFNDWETSEMPEWIGELINLEYLTLAYCNFEGNIPTDIGNLIKLKGLRLENNQLAGKVPNEIINLTNLEEFRIFSNDLTDLPDLSSLSNLHYLNISNNKFTFEDIEPNMNVASSFLYSPQDSVGERIDTAIGIGSSFTMNALIGGENNSYKWLKDGSPITESNESSFTINSFSSNDYGSYSCEVTNSIVPNLIIYRKPIVVRNLTSITEKEELITQFNLYQNYPNPFNPTTKIKYEIPKSSHVQLIVYDNLGREVATLVNEQKPAGSYEVEFIASQFSSGVYFYELRAGDFRDVKKLVLLK